jgi:hypothetical protein
MQRYGYAHPPQKDPRPALGDPHAGFPGRGAIVTAHRLRKHKNQADRPG